MKARELDHDCHRSPDDGCAVCNGDICEKCLGVGFTIEGELDNHWERKCVCKILEEGERDYATARDNVLVN